MEGQLEYQGSQLCVHVENTNDIEQLYNMVKYIDGAVAYWQQVGDKQQIEFFTAAQEHWKTKVNVTVRKVATKNRIQL